MSLDILHDKIRKMKNPSMVDFGIKSGKLPQHLIAEEGSELLAYKRFCKELLEGLQEIVPAVRFPFGGFALYGPDGMQVLCDLLALAKNLGYFVVMDAPEINSPWGADRTAEMIFGGDLFCCDALIVSPWIGSDAIKPFVPYCKNGKSLFVVTRSPNKSAIEMQDLMTGSRFVHSAAAEIVKRFGEGFYGKGGYAQIGALASAAMPQSLMNLRQKNNRMYLLVDGLDYPSGNAKNCSLAFDRFGYGAVVCAGPMITNAWCEAQSSGEDYVDLAKQAAERMKKNITRYVTIL